MGSLHEKARPWTSPDAAPPGPRPPLTSLQTSSLDQLPSRPTPSGPAALQTSPIPACPHAHTRLQVRVRELEGVLREYQRENAKFGEVKERYKAALAAVRGDLAARDAEKKQLSDMCGQLLGRLEREGLTLDS